MVNVLGVVGRIRCHFCGTGHGLHFMGTVFKSRNFGKHIERVMDTASVMVENWDLRGC